jgi:hypothetical protein
MLSFLLVVAAGNVTSHNGLSPIGQLIMTHAAFVRFNNIAKPAILAPLVSLCWLIVCVQGGVDGPINLLSCEKVTIKNYGCLVSLAINNAGILSHAILPFGSGSSPSFIA